jgi:hypothetical protein
MCPLRRLVPGRIQTAASAGSEKGCRINWPWSSMTAGCSTRGQSDWWLMSLPRAVTAALQRTSVRGPTFSVGICNGHRETTTARRAVAVVTIARAESLDERF